MLSRDVLRQTAASTVRNDYPRTTRESLKQTQSKSHLFTNVLTAFVYDRKSIGIRILAETDIEPTATNQFANALEVFR